MALSGRLWPIHLKPKDDELLSSWLVRLARAHWIELHSFCVQAWPGKSIWNRDIDKSADYEIIGVLADKTGIPYEQAFGTALRAYEGVIYEKHNANGNTPWLMPIGVYHRIRRLFGLQYCPECLAEDQEPYFRRKWRLAFITICEKHCTLLWDRCPKCGAPVNFHRNLYDSVSITVCCSCGFDLRRTRPLYVDCFRQLYLQHRLLRAIKDGYICVSGRNPIYAHLYFAVLHQVMKLLVTGRRAYKLCWRVRRYVSIGIPRPLFGKSRGRRFIEIMDVRERFELLTIASWLIEDWPYRFVTSCRRLPLASSDLFKDMRDAPYWYWRTVHMNLCQAEWQPTKTEVIAAINYLKKRSQRVYKQWVANLMGTSIDLRKRRDLRSLFYESGRFHLAA